MSAEVVVVFAILTVAYSVFARGLGRLHVGAPLAFVLAGASIAVVAGSPSVDEVGAIKTVAEVTLALILFHDAAQVRPRQIRAERGPVGRLLLIGLPLTILAGMLGTRLIFPEMSVMVALLLAAALTPTDAGLGAATVLNPVVPVRVRRVLNVESGVNDGLTTPIVLFAIASIAGVEGLEPRVSLVDALVELGVGIAVGAGVGVAGGLALGWSRSRRLSAAHTRALGVLVLPVLAYFLAELVGGNAFVSAFIAGTAFAGAARWLEAEESGLELTEALSEPLGFAVWLVFGFGAVPLVWSTVGWRECLFALLSLTAFRMLPVALALLGSRLRVQTVAFIGWFGPRGLASVIFALIAVESLEQDAELRQAVATIALTVLLSVVAHGITADVLAARYGAWVERARPEAELAPAVEPRPSRRLVAPRQPGDTDV